MFHRIWFHVAIVSSIKKRAVNLTEFQGCLKFISYITRRQEGQGMSIQFKLLLFYWYFCYCLWVKKFRFRVSATESYLEYTVLDGWWPFILSAQWHGSGRSREDGGTCWGEKEARHIPVPAGGLLPPPLPHWGGGASQQWRVGCCTVALPPAVLYREEWVRCCTEEGRELYRGQCSTCNAVHSCQRYRNYNWIHLCNTIHLVQRKRSLWIHYAAKKIISISMAFQHKRKISLTVLRKMKMLHYNNLSKDKS